MKIELPNSPSCLGAVFLINAYICIITYLCIYFMMQSVGLRGLTLEQKWLSLLDLVGQFQIHKKKKHIIFQHRLDTTTAKTNIN